MARPLTVLTLTLALSSPLLAATRMTYAINGTATPIEWASSAFPLRYEIDQRVVQASPSAKAMVDRAFAAWTEIPEANVRFQSGGVVPNASARVVDRISVTLTDDLFKDQGAAAMTSYTYDVKTGRMLDADIALDPSVFDGSINGQLALQHEVGHTLGLDHSAVVAVDEKGQPVGSVLTNAAGEFTLAAIPAGRYRLYAEPLDGPVDTGALQGSWREAKALSFPTEFFSSPVEVENGKIYGNLVLTTSGSIQLNPRWIGVAPVGQPDVSLSASPATVRPGQSLTITVGGDGFTSGMTKFEVLNPAFRRTSDYIWASNYVQATYTVDAAAPASSAVLVVTSGRETAMLTGALRVHRTTGGGRSRAVGK